jgi:hypothetical protein
VVRDRLYQRLTLDMKKVGDKLRAAGLRYYGTLNLPPGTYAVKSLVRVSDEKRGFARVDVTVPKANEMAVLPPIPIDEQPQWLLVKGTERFQAPYPFELSGQHFIPSAQVHTGGKVALIIYGAKPEDLTWETTPKTKNLGQAGTGPATYVLQLDTPAPKLDVTVRAKGTEQKASVAVIQN